MNTEEAMLRWGSPAELDAIIRARCPSLWQRVQSVGGIEAVRETCAALSRHGDAFAAAIDYRSEPAHFSWTGELDLPTLAASQSIRLIVQPHIGPTPALLWSLLLHGGRLAIFLDRRNWNSETWRILDSWFSCFGPPTQSRLRIIAIPDFASGLEARRALRDGFKLVWLPDTEVEAPAAQRHAPTVNWLGVRQRVGSSIHHVVSTHEEGGAAAVVSTPVEAGWEKIGFQVATFPVVHDPDAFFAAVYSRVDSLVHRHVEQWQVIASCFRFWHESGYAQAGRPGS